MFADLSDCLSKSCISTLNKELGIGMPDKDLQVYGAEV